MEEHGKRVIATRIGDLPIDSERIIRFPRGLIGFEGHKEFVLLQIREDSPFLLLQSTEDPGVGLLLADPFTFMQHYVAKIGSAEEKVLGTGEAAELAVLVTVSIPEGRPELTTLNLSGPIVINSGRRVGIQVPQTDPEAPAHFRIHQGRGRQIQPG
jgi:flagellar assembly factor FliW